MLVPAQGGDLGGAFVQARSKPTPELASALGTASLGDVGDKGTAFHGPCRPAACEPAETPTKRAEGKIQLVPVPKTNTELPPTVLVTAVGRGEGRGGHVDAELLQTSLIRGPPEIAVGAVTLKATRQGQFDASRDVLPGPGASRTPTGSRWERPARDRQGHRPVSPAQL